MSARITRKNLYSQINVLNSVCESKGLRDRYELSIWSPGDGWTRYQLCAESGSRTISQVCNLSGMYAVLYTLIRVLERL